MAVALLEPHQENASLLGAMRSDLQSFVEHLESSYLTLSPLDAAATLAEVEQLSNLVDHLQTLAARAAEDHQLATMDTRNPYRNTAEYLRAKLGISRTEANRRLRLGQDTLPEIPGPGAAVTAPMAALAAATSTGQISSRASTLIRDAVHRVSTVATRRQLDTMEEHLTRQAIESDEDILRVLARRWENTIDQDGQEPTEKTLHARQGVFLRGRRHGLHFLEIGATDEEYEHLLTVMNTATNPRAESPARQGGDKAGGDKAGGDKAGGDKAGGDKAGGDKAGGDKAGGDMTVCSPDRPTRAQELLDGLVSACRIALAGGGLPATGGHRPQVMVTINYRDLLTDLPTSQPTSQPIRPGHDGQGHDGHSVYAEQLSARSIRKLACDADILPLVLGGKGQILDIGRTQRLFPPHLRRALVARDKGCAFPDCTTPATWCEAHHITPWATGGTTTISNGVLLCSRHHHTIHQGHWSVESTHGIPWFKPPRHLHPHQTPKRNRYWQVKEAIHQQLTATGTTTGTGTTATTGTGTGTGRTMSSSPAGEAAPPGARKD